MTGTREWKRNRDLTTKVAMAIYIARIQVIRDDADRLATRKSDYVFKEFHRLPPLLQECLYREAGAAIEVIRQEALREQLRRGNAEAELVMRAAGYTVDPRITDAQNDARTNPTNP